MTGNTASDAGEHTLLADSGLTLGWLVDTLAKNNAEFKSVLGNGKVRAANATDISEGEGYASKVYKVTLELLDANPIM